MRTQGAPEGEEANKRAKRVRTYPDLMVQSIMAHPTMAQHIMPHNIVAQHMRHVRPKRDHRMRIGMGRGYRGEAEEAVGGRERHHRRKP